MTLIDTIRNYRTEPHRTWNFASSDSWYVGDDFWLDLITHNGVYREGMIETEKQLITKICQALPKNYYDALIALGPGDGQKELQVLAALGNPLYVPIDINKKQLELTPKDIAAKPIHAEFRDGLAQTNDVEGRRFVYLGSTYSNLDAFDYDLLKEIDQNLKPGDAFYLSVQTCPEPKDLPLILMQYDNAYFERLTDTIAEQIGFEVKKHFVQFNPVERNIEVIATIAGYKRLIEETMKHIPRRIWSQDKIITMLSHKPTALLPELSERFGQRFDICTYQTQRAVPVDGMPYTSTFEGAILTKR